MNDVLKKIKRKSIARGIAIAVVIIIAGAIIGAACCSDLIHYYTANDDLFETPAEYLKEDDWYTCANNILLDYYASDDDGYYFITPVDTLDGEGTYIGFYVCNKDAELASQISDETYAYLMDEGDYPEDYLVGAGKIHEMDSYEARYFEEYFEESEASQDTIDNLCYYTLELTTRNNLIDATEVFGILIFLGTLIGGIVLIIRQSTGGYLKSAKATMKMFNISMQDLEADMQMSTNIGRFYFGRKYMLVEDMTPKLVDYDKLVWAYTSIHKTVHKLYYIIPVGTTKTYSVVFVDRSHNRIEANTKSEEQGKQIIDNLTRLAPHAIVGYSDELLRRYTADFAGMCKYVDDRKYNQFNGE